MKRKIRMFLMFLTLACAMSVFGSATVNAKTKKKSSAKSSTKVIYTGNTRIDAAAEIVINRACNMYVKNNKGTVKANMTNRQKLRACYYYLVKHMKYSHSKGKVKIKVTKKARKAMRAQVAALKAAGQIKFSKKFKSDYRSLLSMQGTCKGMSGVMCILANHLGYKAGYVVGRYVRSNGSSVEHWWNYIIVNGKRYECDVEASNHGNHGKKFKQSKTNNNYLRSPKSKSWRKHHRH